MIQIKRNGREYDITNPETIYPWAFECLRRHRRRHDFRKFLLHDCGMTKADYMLSLTDKVYLKEPAMRAAELAAQAIAERKLNMEPAKIKRKVDKSSFKVREIGCEGPFQQILDYVAINAAMPIFKRRISPNQCSSMKGRGPTYGVSRIQKWLRKDNAAAEYAHRHNRHYTRKCKYFVKLDIKQCYPNIRADIFLRHFEKDCNNPDLLWLWDKLLESHHVNGYEGLLIGALPSQWAAQYIVSFVYRYMMNLHYFRRGKRHQMVSHGLTYMDDMVALSSNRRMLVKAATSIENYIKTEFGLPLKPWHVQKTETIDMMGYLIHADGNVTIRPRVFLRARRVALRIKRRGRMTIEQARRIVAYKGYFFQRGISIKSFRARKKYQLDGIFKQAQQVISEHDKAGRTRGDYE